MNSHFDVVFKGSTHTSIGELFATKSGNVINQRSDGKNEEWKLHTDMTTAQPCETDDEIFYSRRQLNRKLNVCDSDFLSDKLIVAVDTDYHLVFYDRKGNEFKQHDNKISLTMQQADAIAASPDGNELVIVNWHNKFQIFRRSNPQDPMSFSCVDEFDLSKHNFPFCHTHQRAGGYIAVSKAIPFGHCSKIYSRTPHKYHKVYRSIAITHRILHFTSENTLLFFQYGDNYHLIQKIDVTAKQVVAEMEFPNDAYNWDKLQLTFYPLPDNQTVLLRMFGFDTIDAYILHHPSMCLYKTAFEMKEGYYSHGILKSGEFMLGSQGSQRMHLVQWGHIKKFNQNVREEADNAVAEELTILELPKPLCRLIRHYVDGDVKLKLTPEKQSSLAMNPATLYGKPVRDSKEVVTRKKKDFSCTAPLPIRSGCIIS